MNGCDTAASVQSKMRVVPGPCTTFQGWKSPCTSDGPGPIASRRRHDSTRAGDVASHRSRRSAGIRSSSAVSALNSSTHAARPARERTGSPRRTSSSVRDSIDRCSRGMRHDALVPQRFLLLAQLRSTEVAHQQPALLLVDGEHLRRGVRHQPGKGLRQRRLTTEEIDRALEEHVTVGGRGAQDRRDTPELVLPWRADGRQADRGHLLDHPRRTRARTSRAATTQVATATIRPHARAPTRRPRFGMPPAPAGRSPARRGPARPSQERASPRWHRIPPATTESAVIAVRRTTVVSGSSTSTAASISGTRGSSSGSETVGNLACVSDPGSGSATMTAIRSGWGTRKLTWSVTCLAG